MPSQEQCRVACLFACVIGKGHLMSLALHALHIRVNPPLRRADPTAAVLAADLPSFKAADGRWDPIGWLLDGW